MNNMDYKDPEWVADTLGLDTNTVYKMLQDGTIPAVQLGRKWLISESALTAWLAAEAERQTSARRVANASTEHTVRRMDSFTPEARQAIKAAHSEARRYCHTYLGQEHLLLGFATSPGCLAGRILAQLGLTADAIRKEVETRVQPGDANPPPRRLGRTDRCKKAMRLAARQTAKEGERLVSSIHLLQGIAELEEGLGHDILKVHGITADRIASLTQTKDGN